MKQIYIFIVLFIIFMQGKCQESFNHLKNEKSLYLQQHAKNPVDWYPWSVVNTKDFNPDKKPIILSIGYSACHWCHVMEKESFENKQVAEYMNKHFVCIKVDREEYPNVDNYYMTSVQILTGGGGWPLNVFLTPDLKPFFGGTYFPPENKYGRISWLELLKNINDIYTNKYKEVEAQATKINALIEEYRNTNVNVSANDNLEIIQANDDKKSEIFQQINKIFIDNVDKKNGGFGRAPKFPSFNAIKWMLYYSTLTNEKESKKWALFSLDNMLEGGIYDHVGGGIARYSTDNEWLVPHFEKMLYDQSQFLEALAVAYRTTKSPKYLHYIKQTIRFLTQEMMDKDYLFYSAIDADSEGHEGQYYVWNYDELIDMRGKYFDELTDYYGIKKRGNWEGKNIIHIAKNYDYIPENIDSNDWESIKREFLNKLFTERSTRLRPSTDTKKILHWNCLLVFSLVETYRATNDKEIYQIIKKSSDALIHFFYKDYKSILKRFPKHYEKNIEANLDDYISFLNMLVGVYQITLDENILDIAKEISETIMANFDHSSPSGLFASVEESGNKTFSTISTLDLTMPSANSLLAYTFKQLGVITSNPKLLNISRKINNALYENTTSQPLSYSFSAINLLSNSYGEIEIGYSSEMQNILTENILDKFSYPFFLFYTNIALKNGQVSVCKNEKCINADSQLGNTLKVIEDVVSEQEY